jgi:hypothetical protein
MVMEIQIKEKASPFSLNLSFYKDKIYKTQILELVSHKKHLSGLLSLLPPTLNSFTNKKVVNNKQQQLEH